MTWGFSISFVGDFIFLAYKPTVLFRANSHKEKTNSVSQSYRFFSEANYVLIMPLLCSPTRQTPHDKHMEGGHSSHNSFQVSRPGARSHH